MNKSQVVFTSKLPSAHAFPRESVLFYDSILAKKRIFKIWLKGFDHKIALKSGESLKTLSSFESVLKKLTGLSVPQTTSLTFVAVGGGSVGDFVGFLSSVYLRGRPLIQIPSTWLSAVDSAHGGKNGLNLFGEKNQLGTFYPAEKIYVVSDLLETQPSARLQEAMGEFVKTAVISDPGLFTTLERNIFSLNSKMMTSLLPRTVQNKYKIVHKDPFEKTGARRILNLGHTMGHVFESYYGWPHGLCVLLGVLFSVRWSYHLKMTNEETYIRVSNLIEEIWPEQMLSDDLAGIPIGVIEAKLAKDKKRTSKSEIDFIFVKKIGSVVRQRVQIKDILSEVKRQTQEY